MDDIDIHNPNNESDFLSKIRIIIEENLDNPKFSLELLCKEAKLSKSQLFRRIKKDSGLSTSLFVRRIRVEKGAELLKVSDSNISEISYGIGFGSPQNFSKYFLKEFGLSPGEFRKKARIKEKLSIESVDKLDVENDFTNENKRLFKVFRIQGYLLYLLFAITIITLGILAFKNLNFVSERTNDKSREEAVFNNSIAVLPFVNLGNDQTQLFCEGIMDDILTNLTQFENLKVISRTTAIQYKNTSKKLGEIADELSVAYILEGSVRQNNGQLVVTAQLIRAEDDFHVWAKTYNVKVEDIFEVQSELSLRISKSLNQKIFDEKKISDPKALSNIESYNEYLMGHQLMMKRTKPALLEAISRFSAAIELDESFDMAYAQKASAYNLLSNLGYENKSIYDNLAEEFALKAIQINTQNGLAYATLGALYNDQLKWEQSRTALEIALSYTPNDAVTNYWYSLLLRETGQIEKAIEFSSKANQLDPLYPVIYGGHVLNCILGDQAEMVTKLLSEGKALFGESFIYFWVSGKYQESIQNYDSAIYFYQKTLTLNPDLSTVESSIAYCQARKGEKEKVLNFIQDHQRRSEDDYISVMIAYCGLRDQDNAIKYLLMLDSIHAIPKDLLLDKKYDIMRNRPEYLSVLQNSRLRAQ